MYVTKTLTPDAPTYLSSIINGKYITEWFSADSATSFYGTLICTKSATLTLEGSTDGKTVAASVAVSGSGSLKTSTLARYPYLRLKYLNLGTADVAPITFTLQGGVPQGSTAGSLAYQNVFDARIDGGLIGDGSDEQATWEAFMDTVQAAGGGLVTSDLPVIGLGANDISFSFCKAKSTIPSNVRLVGIGPSATKFKVLNGAVGVDQTRIMVNRGVDTGGDVDISVENIVFDGNCFNQTVRTHGLCLRGANRLRVTNVTAKNIRGTNTSTDESFGIDIIQSANARLLECTVKCDDGGSMSSGFSGNFSTNVQWDMCRSEACNHGQGYTAAYCSNLAFTNCVSILAGFNGFNVENSQYVTYNGCISGGKSLVSGTYNAINPYGVAGTVLGATTNGFQALVCTDLTYVGTWSSWNTQNGYRIYDCTRVIATAASAAENTLDGAYINISGDVFWDGIMRHNTNNGWNIDTPDASTTTVLSGYADSNGSAGGGVGFGVKQLGASNSNLIDITRVKFASNNPGGNQCSMNFATDGTSHSFQPAGILPNSPSFIATGTVYNNPYPFAVMVTMDYDVSTVTALQLRGDSRANPNFGLYKNLAGPGTIQFPLMARGAVQFVGGTIGTITNVVFVRAA